MRPGSATTGHAPQRRSLGHLTFHDSGLTRLFTAGRTGRHRFAADPARWRPPDAEHLAAQRVTLAAVGGDTGHHVTSGAGPDPYRSTRWPLPAHSVPSVLWRWIRLLLRPNVTTPPHTGHGWRVHSGARPRLTAAPPIPRRRRAAPSRSTCAQRPPARPGARCAPTQRRGPRRESGQTPTCRARGVGGRRASATPAG